ncbi:MAG TPA: tetratricopeptide repeat protein [Burkholderiales bacterium]|nr:tetratricopeptide repeat protein [Burkholderiales bacterium]
MTTLTVRSFVRVAGLAIALLFAVPANAQTDELQDVNQMLKLGQFDQALTRVNSYLSSRPKDARGRFLKGLILAEQNKPNDAIKVFTDLTQDFPDLPGPYNNLAVLYASQGQYDKARTALEQAIRTHPSYATAHENLGDIYAKMASQAYDKALQLDKSNSTAQSKLNMIRDLFPTDSRTAKSAAAKTEPGKVATAPAAAYDPTKVAPPSAASKPAPVAREPEPATKPLAKMKDPDEVMASVNAWAKSWSDNDIPGYLNAYAPDFRTPKGEARAAWEAERKTRIAKPRKIQVTLESPKVVFDENNRATVTFVQHYSSDNLKATNAKVLVMTKAGDKWLIQQERSGG